MNKELEALITAAVVAVERMSLEERAAMTKAQRQSWARGEAGLRETSASPPRVPVSSARIRWVGVESGPGQPMTDAIWLVYSREHNAFWRPDQRGYTYDIAAAGRYTEADALECCQDRDPQPGKCPSEIAVVAPEAAAEIRRLRSDIAAMNDFVDRTLDGLSTARADGEARYRAGIEAAAKWHDDHAQRCESFGPDDIAAKMLGEDHREAAAAIRTLADAAKSDSSFSPFKDRWIAAVNLLNDWLTEMKPDSAGDQLTFILRLSPGEFSHARQCIDAEIARRNAPASEGE